MVVLPRPTIEVMSNVMPSNDPLRLYKGPSQTKVRSYEAHIQAHLRPNQSPMFDRNRSIILAEHRAFTRLK